MGLSERAVFIIPFTLSDMRDGSPPFVQRSVLPSGAGVRRMPVLKRTNIRPRGLHRVKGLYGPYGNLAQNPGPGRGGIDVVAL